MLDLITTKRFGKDLKLMKKRGKDLKKLDFVIDLLLNNKPLPLKHYDPPLTGNYVRIHYFGKNRYSR